MENNCEYVSSRGILKSCKIHSSSLISSHDVIDDINFDKLTDGDSVYICNTAINNFINNIFPCIKCKFVLVSGDCDLSCYKEIFQNCNEFLKFINDTRVIRWYSQNCTFNRHPKLFKIPIGLDYHTLSNNNNHVWGTFQTPIEQEKELKSLTANSKKFWERIPLCYSNYHFNLYSKDREEAISQVPSDIVYYEPVFITRNKSWTTQCNYTFVLSPYGKGVDCHRTWEAITLGCIPIVKSSGIDSLFDDLPVLIIKNWSDLNKEFLLNVIDTFKNRTFNYNKLNLKYWIHLINGT